MLGELMDYYVQKIFRKKFGCPKANFCPSHLQVDSLVHSILFTALYFARIKGSLKHWNEVGFQGLTRHIIRFRT